MRFFEATYFGVVERIVENKDYPFSGELIKKKIAEMCRKRMIQDFIHE